MLYVKFIDFDGKEWEFKNVVKLDIIVKDTLPERSYDANIGYYDDNGMYHEEIGDIPNIINIEFLHNECTDGKETVE